MRLNEARAVLVQMPKSLLPALLPLALAELYLAAARAGRSGVPQWRRQWRLWRASRSERF
jgi:phytoene synthase